MPFVRSIIIFFVLSIGAKASTPTYDVNTVEPGGLYFATEKIGRVVRAPTLRADVEMTVTGPIVRTRVTQNFENTSDAWLEGIYTYPLPKGSAVDVLKMQVGDRIIEGEIQEKEQAKRTFEAARDSGKRASLVIQRRPNIFSTRLANIGPGEVVKITIEYQDLIEPRDNIFQLRFPMVVRPRYNPGTPLDDRQARAGWGYDTDQVPDGSKITQPLVDGAQDNHNPVSLTVNLNPGFEMASLQSPSHDIAIDAQDRSATVSLAEGDTPADQDFILRWTPRANTAPRIGLFEEQTDEGKHQLLMLLPPTEESEAVEVPARELVIVLDRSGSMGGQAIRQAKAAVRRAVMRLKANDTFNIIAFSSNAQLLFKDSQPVTDRTIDMALDFVSHIVADGGTEMSEALAHALIENEDKMGGRLKQVIFVTDGGVGNEVALMNQIKKNLGNARLFTVGIGSAPNNYFMSEAAHFGRGTFINIAMQDDVMDAMARLFTKIERPQLTNIRIKGLTDRVDRVPATIPDLYDGEPVVIALKNAGSLSGFRLEGERDGKPWSKVIPPAHIGVASGGAMQGVANLWARKKIKAINRSYVGLYGSEYQAEKRGKILKLALGYHLVSDFTSLVAVEQEVARPQNTTLYNREVATNLPAGMNWAQRKRMTISKGLITADAMHASAGPVRARGTATPMMLNILLGLALLAVAGFLLAIRQKQPQRAG